MGPLTLPGVVTDWQFAPLASTALTLLAGACLAAVYAAVVVLGTHLTPLMNTVLENSAFHEAEHAPYLVAGYPYFLPVIGSEPIR